MKTEELSCNLIIKKKYEAIIKTLAIKNKRDKPLYGNQKFRPIMEKYKDEIFPPVYSSIFPPKPTINNS